MKEVFKSPFLVPINMNEKARGESSSGTKIVIKKQRQKITFLALVLPLL